MTTVTATDPDAGQTLSYSISGGADASKFTINADTGALSFITAPNFEAPTDAGGNNVYDVIVQVSDGAWRHRHAGYRRHGDRFENASADHHLEWRRRHGGGIHCREHHCGHHRDGDRPGRRADAELLDHWRRGREQIHHRLPTRGAFASSPRRTLKLPTDAGGNNVYDVTVQVSDGHGGIDMQASPSR